MPPRGHMGARPSGFSVWRVQFAGSFDLAAATKAAEGGRGGLGETEECGVVQVLPPPALRASAMGTSGASDAVVASVVAGGAGEQCTRG
eukprot:1930523-Rhodomonas_salina.2